ncbi:ABC transporter substrate-binding protein [uncultured Desulfobacter sp.]|uniref:ABC transporter substrate-binding protein n=1 Tax=uncultured Desulfobacter sp. TaxID=240139 RepID=UPI002AAA714D|nr:ABC transporter substrate-binding protein [uncultured Desulfobacter sp.]
MKKDMSRIAMWILFVFLWLSIGTLAQAVQYTQAPPLTTVIQTTVGPVINTGVVQVPLITWGGDLATILANGNTAQTSRNSIFDQKGLHLELVRQDDFKNQVEAYMRGGTPYLRGTYGMINMAADVLSRDPRTKPIIIYQHTWSTGGDCVVVKQGIKTAADLKGKTIALQAYGPHVYYLSKIIADAGLSLNDIHIKWVKDLTGSDNTPLEAFYQQDVDAAMMIIPDGLVLTSNGNVGTGSEGSVRGARILLSTKTANRIISDVYAVRSDYMKSNREEVTKFVHGLMMAAEQLQQLYKEKESRMGEFKNMMKGAALILLDSPEAVDDAQALYADCEYAGYPGNVKFFGDPNYPRNMATLTTQIQDAFVNIGLLSKRVSIDHARFDYNEFKKGLTDTSGVIVPKFDTGQVAAVVQRKQQQGTLKEGELFSFEVYFQPNQNQFNADMYMDAFNKVIELAATYGGAIITIEGHSDPLGYLKAKKQGQSEIVLRNIKQSAKNLSLSRANAVRASVIDYATTKGIILDETQFAVVGHGILKPKSGICGSDPCAPRTEQEWRNNMRVEFRIIQVEAETSVFKPL